MASNIFTTAGEGFVVDALDTALATPYVASGTGTVAAAKGDTTLGTEVGTRASGTKTQPTADVLRVVATCSYAAGFAITECGLLTASTAGTLIQRHTFDPVNVVSGDSIQFTVEHEQA
jgi:hypothetical protein